MADSSIKEQRALYAQVALETPEALNALIADLEGSSVARGKQLLRRFRLLLL